MKTICATVAVLWIAASTLAYADGDKFEALEQEFLRLASSKAKITAKQAIETAGKRAAGGKLIEVELGLKGETPVFEVEFLTDSGEKEITIDAVTGNVLENEDEKPDAEEAAEYEAAKKALSGARTTLAQAMDAAMAEVKGGTVVEAKVEVENGRLEFEVELLTGGGAGGPARFMEVKLDAAGKVTKVEVEKAKGQGWTFDGDATGKPPAGWKLGFTNPADGKATWTVAKDPGAPTGPNVLMLETHSADRVFNVAMAEKTSYKDVSVRTRIRADSGKEDQGGGVIWRCKDADNYYICRINPLENNFRVYKVLNGRRQQLATTEFRAETGKWYVVQARMVGHHIECYVDGRKLLDVEDPDVQDAGMVGLWTKADASSSFDDFAVGPAKSAMAATHGELREGGKEKDEDDDDDDQAEKP